MKSVITLMTILFALQAHADIRLIQIEGTSEKSFKPDMATFTLGVWAKGTNAKEAQKLEAKESNRLRAIFKKFKIEDKDIMTSGYSLNPNYIYNPKNGQNTIAGFMAQESISVTLKSSEEVGNFFDEVSTMKEKESGVNINNLSWDIEKRIEVGNDLMIEAVKNARARAEVIAKAAGVKIKNVFRVNPQPIPEREFAPGGLMMKSMAEDAAVPTNLQAGNVKVRVAVNIDFEIE